MLVKVRGDDPSRLSSTERTVANWLKSWTGPHALPGIAVVGLRGSDVVVWTPKTCVVVLLKGFTERVTGTLVCSDTEPWTIDGRIAPLEGVQSGTEPMDGVRARTRELEHDLRAAPGREGVGVTGIVLVIPQLGTRITLEKGPLPDGMDVVVGDGPNSLRAYFTRIAGGDAGTDPGLDSWDAAQVGQALGTLGFAAAATYSDLIAEGFPAPRADRAPAPQQPGNPAPFSAPLPPQSARPGEYPTATRPPGFPPPQYQATAQEPTPEPSYPTAEQPYSVPFDPRPAPPPPRRRGRSIVPLVLLAFLVVVLAIATMCTGGGGTHTTPAPGSQQSSATTSPLTTNPSFTTAPDITIPSDTGGPACFPLQPCPSG